MGLQPDERTEIAAGSCSTGRSAKNSPACAESGTVHEATRERSEPAMEGHHNDSAAFLVSALHLQLSECAADCVPNRHELWQCCGR